MTTPDDITNLQNTINQNSGDGINAYGQAIQNLQSAGNNAVGSIGPAIDQLSNSNPQVMTITQWAWSKNATLASVKSDDSATKDDLSSAVSALQQMHDWYDQAYRLALSVANAKAATPQPAAHSPGLPTQPKPVPVPSKVPIVSKPVTTKTNIPGGAATVGASIGGTIGFFMGGTLGMAGGALVGGAIGSMIKGKM